MSGSVTIGVPAKVTITVPADGSIVGGIVNTFDATFSDPVDGEVSLYIEGVYRAGQSVNGAAGASISYPWDTRQYANGTSHIIEIRAATRTGGIESTGKSIVTIDNDITPPVVGITSPPAGNISGLVDITAGAADNTGVTRVEFFIDGILAGQDTVAPYVYNWDTTNAIGSHTILAKAYDAAGNTGVSNDVSVTVIPTDTTPPDVTASPAGGIYNAPVNVTLSANEAGAIIYYTLDGSDTNY